MGEKYCLSPHTIKQIVFVSKKMEEFKGEIFCCDNYDYKNIKDTYTEIFDRYCSLDTKISQARRIQAIAKEYDYTPANILRIVNKMSCADAEAQFEKSRKKTAKTELVNRNKAMFVEFLSWEGSRKDFFVNAAKKYNLSEIQTRSIINQILDAVPERREMIS